MVILIATGLIIVLAAVIIIIVLYHRYTNASQKLFTARQDKARSEARLRAAKQAAQEAKAECAQAMGQLTTSLESTGQALHVARQIAIVRQQMDELFEVIGIPEGRHANAGQPAVAADPPLPLEPGGMTPYGPREIPGQPVSVPHQHVDHSDTYTRALPVTRPPRAIHPGQRRAG